MGISLFECTRSLHYRLLLRSFHLRFLSVFLCILCKCIHKERKEYLVWLLKYAEKNGNCYLPKYNFKHFKFSFYDIDEILILEKFFFFDSVLSMGEESYSNETEYQNNRISCLLNIFIS